MSQTVYQVLKDWVPGITRENWTLEGIGVNEKLDGIPEDQVFQKVFGKKGHEPEVLAKREWSTLADVGVTDITVNVDGELFLVPVSGEFFEMQEEEEMAKKGEDKKIDDGKGDAEQRAPEPKKPEPVRNDADTRHLEPNITDIPMDETVGKSLEDFLGELSKKKGNKTVFVYWMDKDGYPRFEVLSNVVLEPITFQQCVVKTAQGWVRLAEINDELTYIDQIGDKPPAWINGATSVVSDGDLGKMFKQAPLGAIVRDMLNSPVEEIVFLFKEAIDLDKKDHTDEEVLVSKLHGKIIRGVEDLGDTKDVVIGNVLNKNSVVAIVAADGSGYGKETRVADEGVKITHFHDRNHPALKSTEENFHDILAGIGFSRAGMIVPALGF